MKAKLLRGPADFLLPRSGLFPPATLNLDDADDALGAAEASDAVNCGLPRLLFLSVASRGEAEPIELEGAVELLRLIFEPVSCSAVSPGEGFSVAVRAITIDGGDIEDAAERLPNEAAAAGRERLPDLAVPAAAADDGFLGASSESESPLSTSDPLGAAFLRLGGGNMLFLFPSASESCSTSETLALLVDVCGALSVCAELLFPTGCLLGDRAGLLFATVISGVCSALTFSRIVLDLDEVRDELLFSTVLSGVCVGFF